MRRHHDEQPTTTRRSRYDDDRRPPDRRSFFWRHFVVITIGGLMFLGCGGFFGSAIVVGMKEAVQKQERDAEEARLAAKQRREVNARLDEADKQWKAGQKKEATDEYRAVLDLDLKTVPDAKQRGVIHGRFIEWEISRGDEKAAKVVAEKALDAKIDPTPEDDGAKKFLAALHLQRKEKAEEVVKVAKAKRDEEGRKAEEAWRKRADAEMEARATQKKADEERRQKLRAEAKSKAEEEHEQNGLVLLRKTEQATGGIGGRITGTIENRTGRDLRYVQVTYNLYDEAGNKVGSALANVAGLEKGERWKFEATTFGREYATYRIGEMFGR